MDNLEVYCRQIAVRIGAIKGAGDVVALVATPIARVLKLDCVDQKTQELKPESDCSRRKREMNEATASFFK